MKVLIFLSAVLAITIADNYSATHDGIDIETYVNNPTSLQALTQCFVDKGPCDEIASHFKKGIQEATETACAKCTPQQKHMLKRYLQEMQKHPEDLKVLTQKYDPEGKYVEPLRAALADA